jgi:TatD DNase family protein
MSRMVDAHCHVREPDWIPRALRAGVRKVFCGGIDPEDWTRQARLKEAHPEGVLTSFGVHPWFVDQEDPPRVTDALRELEARASIPDAIGETGLDFHASRNPERFAAQREAFRSQIRIAQDFGKPLVLHVVRAHSEALQDLREACFEGPMLVHSFSGSLEHARAWIRRGALLSFNGRLLIPGKYEKAKKVIREIPIESLLLETDGINEPACIRDLYEGVAVLRGWDLEFLTQKLDENFSVFG